MNCDPNKQPSGHGRPPTGAERFFDEKRLDSEYEAAYQSATAAIDRLILDLDGSQCVSCKGGQIVALETSETTTHFTCLNCGAEGDREVDQP